jgi:hypothetical protein
MRREEQSSTTTLIYSCYELWAGKKGLNDGLTCGWSKEELN